MTKKTMEVNNRLMTAARVKARAARVATASKTIFSQRPNRDVPLMLEKVVRDLDAKGITHNYLSHAAKRMKRAKQVFFAA